MLMDLNHRQQACQLVLCKVHCSVTVKSKLCVQQSDNATRDKGGICTLLGSSLQYLASHKIDAERRSLSISFLFYLHFKSRPAGEAS